MVAIAGGSASGKSSLANELISAGEYDEIALVSLDDYYRQLSPELQAQAATVNFDHPDAFDFDLLVTQLKELKTGKTVHIPTYDFTCHQRGKDVRRVDPRPIVIVEGILVLHTEALRELFDFSIFVDASEVIRFERRLQRDCDERGRSAASIIEQWRSTVEPSFEQYVLPTKEHAKRIVSGEGMKPSEVNLLLKEIRGKMVGEQKCCAP
jgi:uridine kinase